MDFGGFNGGSDQELINELFTGMQLTQELKGHIGPESSTQTKQLLASEIQSSYDRALSIVGGSMEHTQHHMGSSILMPASPVSAFGSPQSEDLNGGFNDQQDDSNNSSRKRNMPSWTKQMQVSREDRPEGPPGDGYTWRKYGQKDILGATYPRSYYRCTYRPSQGCYAIKHVQRSDEDPTIFNVTYKGKHTCTSSSCPNFATTTAENREPTQNNFTRIEYQHQPSNMMFSSQQGPSVDTTAIGNMNIDGHTFPPTYNNYFHSSSSASFGYPVASDPTYFSCSPTNMDNYQGLQYHQHFESDTHGIHSAAASTTDSPTIFPFNHLSFNPSSPFDHPGFFP